MLNQVCNRVLHRLRLRESWVVFFVMGIIMMNFPFLGIFNRNDTIFGFPVMFLYLFAGWAVSIFVIYLFTLAAERPENSRSETEKP